MVGQRKGGINPVHGHQQPVGAIDLAVVVHIAEQPVQRWPHRRPHLRRHLPRRRLRPHLHPPRRQRLHHKLHRPHAHLDAKGRVHIRNQPCPGNHQPIRPRRARRQRHRRTTRSPSGNPYLPIHQHHPPGLMRARHRQAVEVHPRGRGTTRCIRAIPPRPIRPGRLRRIHQRRHVLTEDVEDLQPHL